MTQRAAPTYTIGIDLGGTYIKGGLCSDTAALHHQLTVETKAANGVSAVLARMAGLVDALIEAARVDRGQVLGVGVGAPGPMSHEQGVIHRAPNLPGWVNIPVRRLFADLTRMPVVLENDANAAAFGEFVAGAGRGVPSLVLLTLGTGIGGGIVADGRLWRGAYDNAGEIGHLIVVPDGRACPCGQRGCLERYASANAIAELFGEAVRGGADSTLAPRVLAGDALDARDVLSAAMAGDALARDIWDTATRFLALGIANLQHVFNPARIALGGGLANAGAPLLGSVRQHVEKEYWKIAPDAPEVVLAALGSDAGTIGAAMLARAALDCPRCASADAP